ncbi:hypothetical protein D9757_013950 [Collybiopsis confluens]|uniref:Uncharacterized protein n=1 Tax=Collybiopsis confluens TaxID=2823264 RepID=A0A8H5LIQ8_9AGAR|nr:hypothetical protein D9757_013950 [Collybiopsis confluens]
MEQSSQASVVPSFKAGSSDFLTFVLTVTPLVHDYAASAPPPPSSDTDLIMITSFMLDATSFPFTTVPVAPVRTSSVTVFPVPEDGQSAATSTTSTTFTSASTVTSPPNTWQSAGFDSVVTTTSTSSFTATSDGHLITGTTLVPFTTTLTSMLLYAAQSSAATAIQLSGNKSTLIPAIVGSLVGALAFGVGIFLYLRCRSRLRQRAFHRMTPSIDIEESAAAQPTRQLARLEKLAPEEAVNLDEPSTTRNSANLCNSSKLNNSGIQITRV